MRHLQTMKLIETDVRMNHHRVCVEHKKASRVLTYLIFNVGVEK